MEHIILHDKGASGSNNEKNSTYTKYSKIKTQKGHASFKFKEQRNVCIQLYKKERIKYHENLDLKKVTDEKNFGKNIVPFFSCETIRTTKIYLKKNTQDRF